MTPLLFGDSTSPLFGVLHEPSAEAERSHGVIICPPIAHEHIRTHWALRQVAGALARAGYHVLRFDWHGVGDSAGELSDGSVARWVEDTRTAAQELRDATGLRKLALVGLRFGATIAALAARSIKPSSLVLRDPLTSGADYLSALRALHAKLVADPNRFWKRWPPSARAVASYLAPDRAGVLVSGADELIGFRFGAALQGDVAAIEMQALVDVGKTHVTVIESEPRKEIGVFVDRLSERGARVERKSTSAPGRWDDPRQVEELFLPTDAGRVIAEVLEGKKA